MLNDSVLFVVKLKIKHCSCCLQQGTSSQNICKKYMESVAICCLLAIFPTVLCFHLIFFSGVEGL